MGASFRERMVEKAVALQQRMGEDRGDVPGWVLISLMTAGIVVAIWAVASPLLVGVFENAIKSVNGP